MKLSIIIPAYNVAWCIGRCLDSLVSQNLKIDYELIVVNDGSKDNTAQVVNDYSHLHPGTNLRLISQENGGLASARNKGLDNAVGDWIWFVDADDFVAPGGMQMLLDKFWDEELDILGFSLNTVDFNKINQWEEPKSYRSEILYDGYGLELYYERFQSYVWGQIYRKSLFDNITIPNTLRYCEDFYTNFLVFMQNPRVRLTDLQIYRYVVNPYSLTTRKDKKSLLNALDGILTYWEMLSKFKETCDDEKLIQSIRRNISLISNGFFSRFLSANLSKIEFEKIKLRLDLSGVLPLFNISKNITFFNWLCRGPKNMQFIKYKVSSFLFLKLFVPLVLKRLSKKAKGI